VLAHWSCLPPSGGFLIQLLELRMDYISLSDYRDNTSHLERIFSVDRHACVNDREKLYWCQIALRFLLEYQRFSCRTAQPAEINRFESVCKSIYSYLSKHYNHTFDSLWGCMINERSAVMGSINFKTAPKNLTKPTYWFN
jgi:hypothetical protein